MSYGLFSKMHKPNMMITINACFFGHNIEDIPKTGMQDVDARIEIQANSRKVDGSDIQIDKRALWDYWLKCKTNEGDFYSNSIREALDNYVKLGIETNNDDLNLLCDIARDNEDDKVIKRIMRSKLTKEELKEVQELLNDNTCWEKFSKYIDYDTYINLSPTLAYTAYLIEVENAKIRVQKFNKSMAKLNYQIRAQIDENHRMLAKSEQAMKDVIFGGPAPLTHTLKREKNK